MRFLTFAFRRKLMLAILMMLALIGGRRAFADDTITFGGKTYVAKGLVGVGRLPADLRDKFGENFGSGSGLAPDPQILVARGRRLSRHHLYVARPRLQHQRHRGLPGAAQ